MYERIRLHEMIDDDPNQRRSNILIDLSRKQLKVLTIFLTGNRIFMAHLKKIGLPRKSECRC